MICIPFCLFLLMFTPFNAFSQSPVSSKPSASLCSLRAENASDAGDRDESDGPSGFTDGQTKKGEDAHGLHLESLTAAPLDLTNVMPSISHDGSLPNPQEPKREIQQNPQNISLQSKKIGKNTDDTHSNASSPFRDAQTGLPLSPVFSVLVLGGGPAGYTAAIYAARAGLLTGLVAGPIPGGQLTTTTLVENYPGFKEGVQGPELMREMEAQVKKLGVTCLQDTILSVDFKKQPYLCRGSQQVYQAKSIVIATGAKPRLLGIPSEALFWGGGVSTCATCDGFFFRNKRVMVVGGGNSAVEEALFLAELAESVILVHRRDTLRAEHLLQKKLLNHPKITILWDSIVDDIVGETEPHPLVTGAHLINVKTREKTLIPIDGIFIAIGHIPATDFLKGALKLDEEGYIVTSNRLETSVPGIFAAGDVQDKQYRQAITAAGQGCMAGLEAGKMSKERDAKDYLS
jgi:thioredoxin reductase (NADPH)